MLCKTYKSFNSCILYVRKGRKYENRNSINSGLLGGYLEFFKQGYRPNYFVNLTSPLIAAFCLLQRAQNMKIVIASDLVFFGAN